MFVHYKEIWGCHPEGGRFPPKFKPRINVCSSQRNELVNWNRNTSMVSTIENNSARGMYAVTGACLL